MQAADINSKQKRAAQGRRNMTTEQKWAAIGDEQKRHIAGKISHKELSVIIRGIISGSVK